MQPSAFTPGGLLLLSSETPSAELLHQTALRLLSTGEPGDLSTELGSFVDCLAYALAVVFARIQYRQRQIDNERLALGAYELLAALEEEFGLRPGAKDTIAQRQTALLAAVKPIFGSRRPVLEQALADLLGTGFVGLVVRDPKNNEVDLWPTNLNDNPMLLAEATIPRKLVRITSSISTDLGVPQSVAYVPVYPTGTTHTLAVGDKLIVGPENLGLAERVVVEALGGSGDDLLFTATFTNAHDEASLAVQMPFPAWGSSQRHVFVAVTEAVTTDAVLLSRVHTLLARHVTTCTTWSICVASGAGDQIGPWTLDDAVLGRLDFNPMATIPVP